MRNIIKRIALAGVAASMMGVAAHALTATSTFQAQIVIQNDCSVSSPNTLDFGTVGLLSANTDASMTFTVTCTNGAAYTISMNDGQNASGTTNRMANAAGTEFVSYELYQDSNYSTVWDATSTVSGTGTGTAQTYTVYGRVPPQATPSAGTYTDTVTITVTY